MSEAATEDAVLESAASEEVQKEAEGKGWIPPSRFKGDATKFVDADAYIKHHDEVLPIVKKQLSETREQLNTIFKSQQETAAALAEAQTALKDIEARHTVDKQRAVDDAKKSVKAALAKAVELGDHEAVAELTEKMVELRDIEPLVEKKGVKAAPKDEPIPPEYQAWMDENPWFKTDKRKTAFAMAVAQELRDKGDVSVGRPFFAKVSAEVEAFFNPKQDRVESKVESSRGGANNSSSGKKSFDSLPADAKAACTADTRRFVGEGKMFKTAGEWHSYYAEQYFKQD